MLEIYKSSGRKPKIPPEIQQVLINELNEKEGFSSYKEIQTWLYTVHDTPEVNPIERLWRYLKDRLQWYVFESLDLLRITLSKTLNKLNNSIVSSITCYPFIVDALCAANI